MKPVISDHLRHQLDLWRKRWRLSESTVLVACALLVGLTSGVGIWLFKRLIDVAHLLFFGMAGANLSRLGTWTVFLVPVMGGVIVGLISHFVIGEERFHGVSGIMNAVAFEGALFPALYLAPSAFALVGMAAVLAGAVHAPLTAIILLFEMTGDYRIVLPLIFSTTVSLVISQRLQKDGSYVRGLARAGIRLERRR